MRFQWCSVYFSILIIIVLTITKVTEIITAVAAATTIK